MHKYLVTLIGLDVELAGKRVEQLGKLETHQGQPVLKIKYYNLKMLNILIEFRHPWNLLNCDRILCFSQSLLMVLHKF
jgi:hypothetical protein